MIEFETTGLAELERALAELPDKIARNAVRGALRAGAVVYRNAARDSLGRAVKQRSGDLFDSIRVSARLRNGVPVATVTAGSKKAFYAHMVEYGTKAHLIKPKSRKSLVIAGIFSELVNHPGAAAKPFMRPAFDSASGAAVEAYATYIRRRLDRLQVRRGTVSIPE